MCTTRIPSAGSVYPLEVTHVAIVAWVRPAQDELIAEDRLLAVARELAARASCESSLFLSAGKHVAWAWLGSRTRPDDARIAALLDPRRTDGILIAVGEPAPGLTGFRNSHAEALSARRLARLSKHRAGSVTRRGSVAVLGLLSADAERAREFVSRELGPLDAEDDAMARLRATLAVCFREGDVIAATARRLGVHINTISYRLRQCEELLERPVKQRRFEFEAALLLRDRLAISLAVPPPAERCTREPSVSDNAPVGVWVSSTSRATAHGRRWRASSAAHRRVLRRRREIDPCFCHHRRARSRVDRALGARAARRARAAVSGPQLDVG